MTIEEGLKIAGYNEVEIAHLKSYHEGYRKGWENAMDTAKRITNVEYSTEYQEGACKVENRPIDEGKTDKGLDIPEATDRTEIERLKADTDRVLKILSDSLVRLQANVCQLEKKVERLENANSDSCTINL